MQAAQNADFRPIWPVEHGGRASDCVDTIMASHAGRVLKMTGGGVLEFGGSGGNETNEPRENE
jgi:hypothetical protein